MQTRRDFLTGSASGLGLVALASLLKDDNLLAAPGAHFTPKARSGIFIFLIGGVSQIELLDPKPQLNRLAGQPIPESFRQGVRLGQTNFKAPLMASPFRFRRYGRCGMELSEMLPHIGSCADDITRIWWDVRPHPRYGTFEVRMPDQPTRLEATAALAGLVHALVSRNADREGPADRGAYAENRWAAMRFGRDARLIHPDGRRLVSVSELLDELAELLGDEAAEPVRQLDQAGEQLELGRAEGLDAVCRRLVELT